MNEAVPTALLERLYSDLAQQITERCIAAVQTPQMLSTLLEHIQLDERIQTQIQHYTSQQTAASSNDVQELQHQIELHDQMIVLLQESLVAHATDVETLQDMLEALRNPNQHQTLMAQNADLQAQIERQNTLIKRLEKENAAFRMEISNNRTFVLERLTALQEDLDRLSASK